MTQSEKMLTLDFIDHLGIKNNRSKLFMIIENIVEEEDWLEAAKPVVRIHKVIHDCAACEG